MMFTFDSTYLMAVTFAFVLYPL